MARTRRSLLSAAATAMMAGPWSRYADALAASDADPPPLSALARMQRLAEAYLARHQAPGIGVAVCRGGRILHDEAFGFADPERSERLTPQHRQRIASATKPITATAIFLLAERGSLRLTDRVFGRGALLGDRFVLPPGQRWLDEITVDHLLTHTAGGWINDDTDPMFRDPGLESGALIASTLRTRALQARPGSAYAYSNFGYCVLGRVIERVTGQSYETFVNNHVMRPIGRRISVGGNTLAERQPREVHYAGGPAPYRMNVRRMDSHGGLIATPSDLAEFAAAADGRGPVRLLSASGVAAMTTPSQVNPGYARGWSVNRLNNWWHAGTLPGTTSIVVRTRGGLCWAAIVNAGSARSAMASELDELVWAMVREVPGWRA